MVKKVMANYYGHDILVVNTWLGGAELFIDGECRAGNRQLFALDPGKALLSAELEIQGQFHLVEVFVRAILTVEIKICVDGKQVGGEVF